MTKSLPIIIQNIVYRKKNRDFEVLILKRAEDRGGFWNVINGTLEFGESVPECRDRELLEEAGVKSVLNWTDELHRFSFEYNNHTIVVLVYGAEIEASQSVVINEEHTEYKWVSFDEAIRTMKFDDDKKGLQICQDILFSHKQ